MTTRMLLVLLLAAAPLAAAAPKVDESVVGEAVERHLPGDEQFSQWTMDPERLAVEAGDRLETRVVMTVEPETVKLHDVVPPIRFASGVAEVPDSTIEELRQVLESMKHRNNVRLNLVGHADNQPLSPALAARYGDNEGLSRERAGEVAELFQRALDLPPEAVSYEWAGDSQPVASNATEAGRAQNRRVEVEVWYDVLSDKLGEEEFVVTEDLRQVKVCRMETVCKLRYVEGHARRARVQNLIAPLHYDAASLAVTPTFVAQIHQTLDNLGDKQNVVVKFIGYTDDAPLAERDARIYGDHVSLSKARAHRVALAVQDALDLPATAIDSDGHGTDRAITGNATPEGRALNRRIEVEFWYDDALQELPGEPQLCPADAAAETVTRVYDPPWGDLPALTLVQGQPVIPAGYFENVRRALNDVADKGHPRLRFIGYTGHERLDRRTALIYGDDVGLSAARARRAMETVTEEMGLDPSQAEHQGRGYLQSKDVINAGFTQGQTSYVEVQVVYDELAVLDDYEGVEVSPLTRELTPANPFALNLMRITVDGEPIDDPGRSSADVQRCTDVAMQTKDIRFSFDNLTSEPRLDVAASTEMVEIHTINPVVAVAAPVRFRMYTNYGAFIDRAEVRIFDGEASTRSTPVAVLPIGTDGYADWRPDSQAFAGPIQEMKYVLRAYGAENTFDETTPRELWMVHSGVTPAELYAQSNLPAAEGPIPDPDKVALSGYGTDRLAFQNIPLSSGTVTVEGRDLGAAQDVWVAGTRVPVDTEGNFISEAILPTGTHTVEVALLDDEGSGELYLRDLELEKNDWFYAGMADFTWSENSSSDNADLFVGENANQDFDSSIDGRIALYASGKFGNGWGLTTSVDTREDEIGKLFSNFLGKEPDALFRRIDPDYHYPTFGDDSTVEELAPTQGKLYLKVDKDESYG
ncbi:MAG: OmpA family protein, partial [Gammaproteobacteria bacterium]